jgi:hypothetical protein
MSPMPMKPINKRILQKFEEKEFDEKELDTFFYEKTPADTEGHTQNEKDVKFAASIYRLLSRQCGKNATRPKLKGKGFHCGVRVDKPGVIVIVKFKAEARRAKARYAPTISKMIGANNFNHNPPTVTRLSKARVRFAARHEAGHALLFLFHGIPFDYVRVVFEDRGRGLLGEIWGYFDDRPYKQKLLINLGGLAGERVGRCRPGRIRCFDARTSGARHDIRDARRTARWYCGSPGKAENNPLLHESFVTAWDIIKANAMIHSKIVDALLTQGKLTYDEVIGLTA